MKAKKIAIAGLAFAALIALVVFEPWEPRHKGKTLREWLSFYPGSPSEDELRSEALKAMHERAVPILKRRLEWEPSEFLAGLSLKYQNRIPLIVSYQQGITDPRSRAAHDLGRMGDLATNAIPQLIALTNKHDLNSSWHCRGAAAAALALIRHDPLPPLFEPLNRTNDIDVFYQQAMLVGALGTNGRPAIPLLLNALTNTHPVIHAHALIALGMVGSEPERCVLAILPFIAPTNGLGARQKAAFAMAAFAEKSELAEKALLTAKGDPDPYVRRVAEGALKRAQKKQPSPSS
ncbi:MAG: HEAT repeat domain-containing protein [Proteobacteria bacterium]|nr:HEAT repeat domain-containing protein [Verrucomicrobiota bacterium]NBU08869.1 HEAT repeat domain-containing protein [Pseudomonadota bacterium]